MTRRTRMLLLLLVLVSAFAFVVIFDWSVPGKLYRGYQQSQAFIPTPEQREQLISSLRAEFGENVDVNYSVGFDQSGEVNKTVQVVWFCGTDVDGPRFLRTAVRKLNDIGFGWPDHVEMLFRCGFAQPE
ncbi:hypothetical protein PS3A_17020 [Pseudomonas sp. 3A(2025)]